jgi:hypothetical protein
MSNFIETFQVICEMIYSHKDVATTVVINEVLDVQDQTTACDESPREQETAQEEVQAYEEKRLWLGTHNKPDVFEGFTIYAYILWNSASGLLSVPSRSLFSSQAWTSSCTVSCSRGLSSQAVV